jgi:hypothetical protein
LVELAPDILALAWREPGDQLLRRVFHGAQHSIRRMPSPASIPSRYGSQVQASSRSSWVQWRGGADLGLRPLVRLVFRKHVSCPAPFAHENSLRRPQQHQTVILDSRSVRRTSRLRGQGSSLSARASPPPLARNRAPTRDQSRRTHRLPPAQRAISALTFCPAGITGGYVTSATNDASHANSRFLVRFAIDQDVVRP